MKTFTAKLHSVAAFALVCALANPAFAQQTPQSADDEDTENPEIVITAQFKQENLQKAAIPVDVIGGDDIAKAGVTTPSQLTNLVPALQAVDAGANSTAFFIRGVGTFSINSIIDPGVAFNVDGIYQARTTSLRNAFYDLERVEVLKGPQGTLYGRNATGGAINAVIAKPKLGETGGYLSADYGNYNDVKLDGALNVAFTENAALRIAGTYNNRDGYLSDGTQDADGYALRGQMLVEPSKALSIRISADYSHSGGKGPGAVLRAGLGAAPGTYNVNPVARNIGYNDPRTATALSTSYIFLSGRFATNFPGFNPQRDTTNWGIKGEVNADLGFGNLTVLAANRRGKFDNQDTSVGLGVKYTQRDKQFSLETRLAGKDEGLIRWLVGGYYFDEKIRANLPVNTQVIHSFQAYNASTKASAGFARITVAPTDELRLVGGYRYTSETRRFNALVNQFTLLCSPGTGFLPILSCPTTPFFTSARTPDELIARMNLIPLIPGALYALPGQPNVIIPRTTTPVNPTPLKANKSTFRAAVEYDVGPRNLLYASFETGFHAGGFALAPTRNKFNPETIDAFTIGSKNRFMDGKLQLNFEAFLWKYKDQQVTYLGDDQGVPSLLTENIGKSTNKGFEIAALVRPTKSTTLTADVQYLSAKNTSFVYEASLGAGPPTTSCPLKGPGTLPGTIKVDCTGTRALHAPEWTFSIGGEQEVELGGDLKATLGVNTRYQSSTIISFERIPGLSEERGYFTTNASIDLAPENGKWTVGAYINNMENFRPYGSVNFGPGTGLVSGLVAAPRTYGVRARVNF